MIICEIKYHLNGKHLTELSYNYKFNIENIPINELHNRCIKWAKKDRFLQRNVDFFDLALNFKMIMETPWWVGDVYGYTRDYLGEIIDVTTYNYYKRLYTNYKQDEIDEAYRIMVWLHEKGKLIPEKMESHRHLFNAFFPPSV